MLHMLQEIRYGSWRGSSGVCSIAMCIFIGQQSQSGRKAKCAGANDYFLINMLLVLFDYELP